MHHDPQHETPYAKLFPDEASHRKAVAQLDLDCEVPDGIERRTVAVFRCSRIAAEHHSRFSTRLVRQSLRISLAVAIVAVLVLRAGAGIAWVFDRSALLLNFLPLAGVWKTIRQAFFSQPDYTPRLGELASQPSGVELAAFHQLSSLLVSTLLWGGLLMLAAILLVDFLRRRSRRCSSPSERPSSSSSRAGL